MNFRLLSFAAIGGALALLAAPRAGALPITFSGSAINGLGNSISASATFGSSVAGVLTIELTNTDTTPFHIGGADVLTGLYFNIAGATLTPISTALGSNSAMLPNSSSSSGISSNWGYFGHPGLVNGAQAGDQAIAATGLVGGSNIDFTGVAHGSSGYLQGPAYGIVGNTADTFSGNGFVPLAAPTILFSFNYTGTITSITNVDFLYGTSAGEGFISHTHTTTVPDSGATITMLGMAIAGLACFRRRRA